MLSWQTLAALLIVAAAAVHLLLRLRATLRRGACSGCSGAASCAARNSEPVRVGLDAFSPPDRSGSSGEQGPRR